MRRKLVLILSFLLIFNSISSISLATANDPIRLISIKTMVHEDGDYVEQSLFTDSDTIRIIAELDAPHGIDLSEEGYSSTGIFLEKIETDDQQSLIIRRPEFQISDITQDFHDGSQGQGYVVLEILVAVEGMLASGEYRIYQFTTRDNDQNMLYYSYDENDPAVFTINNTIDTDVTAPYLENLKITPQIADAADQESVLFTVTASDDSAVMEAFIIFRHVEESTDIRLFSTEPDLIDDQYVFTLEFQLNEYTKPGDYIVESVTLYDQSSLVNAARYSFELPYLNYEVNRLFNDNHQTSFSVVNDLYVEPEGEPQVTQIELSEPFVNAGDSIEITVTVNDRGTAIDYMWLRLLDGRQGYAGEQIGFVSLSRLSDNEDVFTGTFYVPVNWQSRPCIFGYYIQHKSGMNTQYDATFDEDYDIPNLNIVSVFEGAESKAVLKDEVFDPLQGVSAENLSEGDMTDRIIVSGSVDTSRVGLYLLKYTIITERDPIEVPGHQSINRSGTYQAVRWIGVNEQLYDEDLEALFDGDVPLVMSDQSIQIYADESEILIEKDGVLIDSQNELTDEGVYTVIDNSIDETFVIEPEDGFEDNQEGLSASGWQECENISLSYHEVYFQAPLLFSSSSDEQIETQSVQYQSTASATIVIDKSAPELEHYEVSKDQNDDLIVQLYLNDLTAIKHVSYLAGENNLENRDELESGNGISIGLEHAFIVSNHQTYLIRAVDLFDNVSYFEMMIDYSDDQNHGDYNPNDFEFEIIDDEIVITNYTGTSQHVYVPDEIQDLPVTGIGDAVFKNKNLLSVDLPSQIRTIGIEAFAHNQLSDIFIEGMLESIGDRAFYDNRLEIVSLGWSLQSIGDGAFNLNPLSYAYVPIFVEVIGDGAFPVHDDLLIHGYSGTVIEQYCQENGIQFRSLGSFDDDMNFTPPREFTTSGMIDYAMNPETGLYQGNLSVGLVDLSLMSGVFIESAFYYDQTLSTYRPIPAHLVAIEIFFEISVYHETDADVIIELKVTYDPDDLPEGVDASMLRLYRFNVDSENWYLLPNQRIDYEQHQIIVSLTGFSEFAVLADTTLTDETTGDDQTGDTGDQGESGGQTDETTGDDQTGDTGDQGESGGQIDETTAGDQTVDSQQPGTSTSDENTTEQEQESSEEDQKAGDQQAEKVDNPKTGQAQSVSISLMILLFMVICLAGTIFYAKYKMKNQQV